MPTYEYRCENGHVFEVMQRMADAPVTTCERCDAPVQRVMHPVAVHFKGSGFYNTDYGTKKRAREIKEAGEGGSSKEKEKGKQKSGDDKSSGSNGDSKKADSSSESSSASKDSSSSSSPTDSKKSSKD